MEETSGVATEEEEEEKEGCSTVRHGRGAMNRGNKDPEEKDGGGGHTEEERWEGGEEEEEGDEGVVVEGEANRDAVLVEEAPS